MNRSVTSSQVTSGMMVSLLLLRPRHLHALALVFILMSMLIFLALILTLTLVLVLVCVPAVVFALAFPVLVSLVSAGGYCGSWATQRVPSGSQD